MTSAPRTSIVNKWAVAMTVMLPTFIEIMDTSVVNVSLPHIQGSLSAGLDEVSWVLTSYLVSNAIIIPITGWLSGLFGRRRYLMLSLVLFTGSSVVCGLAPSLGILVAARILQGLGGGGLQPLSQAILLESFPPEEHGMAMAVFGMGVVLAPIMGPVFGGWLTDTWSWRWVFYLNLPTGILAVVLVWLFIHDPPYIHRRRLKIDSWGLLFLTVGVSCLQIVLDKGQREDWFSSDFIVTFSLVAAAALALFVWVELRTEHPVVDLRAFRDRSFSAGTLIAFCGFFCLFGSFILLPLFLQNLMGYTALWAGLVLGPGGIAAFLSMPVAGFLMKQKVAPRTLLAIGLTFSAAALWRMSGFNLSVDFKTAAWPRLVQGFGIGLFFVPLSAASFVSIPREKTGNASGIFNLMRNLGASFGVAFATTMLARHTQLQQNALIGHISPYHPAFQLYYENIQKWLYTQVPQLATPSAALDAVYREVLRQAAMLAFNDTFRMLCLATALLVPLTLMFGRSRAGGGPDIPV
jgi:DHA2 family multidrug resistance protein